MNCILFTSDDIFTDSTITLTDHRHVHIRQVLKAQVGDVLSVGVVNGKMGTGAVVDSGDSGTTLLVTLDREPPAPHPATLVLALPRPKVMKRVVYTATTMGVKTIHIMNAWRVEKSYWDSPMLAPEFLHQQMMLGLEQAKDTVLPTVHFHRFFTQFVRKELPALRGDVRGLLAHPYESRPLAGRSEKIFLAIGPEGGFIQKEVDTFRETGFETVSLGERILRVETAVPVLLGLTI